MITWRRTFFSFPRRSTIVNIFLLHDLIFVVLFRTLLMVMFNFYFSYEYNGFKLTFSENHYLEFVWTVIPFLILSFIIFSSLRSLYLTDSCFFCGTRLLVTGHQWYWSYSIKDFDNFYFDSYIIPNFLRVLDVDNRLVLPYLVPVRILVSSSDVIHSWTLPSTGVKIDCVPGRLNQRCIIFNRSGIFFGQCSEICGINHRFIPIVVEAVGLEDFFSLFL